MVFAIIGQASSWVGLAFGGGLIGAFGPAPFFLIAAAVLYRMYRVIRYPGALDARPPNLFGKILRGLGWVVMAIGAAGMAAMILRGPLAMLLFGGGGPNGIAFFVIALYATMAASVGWIGCLLFEASRFAGTRVAPVNQRTGRQRAQDWSALAVLAGLAIAAPFALKQLAGTPCYGLSSCAAQVDGSVARRLAVPLGVPVVLETNIDEIEYRQTHGHEWTYTERPAFSLLRAGHPVAATNDGPVKVSLQATPADKGVTVVLTASENGQQTARFTTRFLADARIVAGDNASRKLVIKMARGASPMLAGGDQGKGVLDAVYRQMRSAIGSPREVTEERMRVKVTAVRLGASELGASWKGPDKRIAPSCDGLLKLENGKAEHDPELDMPMWELPLLAHIEPRVTLLFRRGDDASCTADGVWLADSSDLRKGLLYLRKYDLQGVLQRSLLVSVPTDSPDDFPRFDLRELAEHEGMLEFAYVVSNQNAHRMQRFRVNL